MSVPQRYRSLADYFEQTGATHQSLADQVGCSRSLITLLVSKRRTADVPLAMRLEKTIGVPWHTLVRREVSEALR